MSRIVCDCCHSNIYVSRLPIVEFLVSAGEASGLTDFPSHAEVPERGTNGVDCSAGSFIAIRDSAMKEAERSGLSSAARPTCAQNSI
jgi:hypothetical protein